jgi:hypothetical protein
MAAEREVIFEFLHVGTAYKVTAVDVATGIEASIVADPSVSETALKRLAQQKLDYVMAKRKD